MKLSYNKCKDQSEAFQEVKKAITPEMLAKFKVKADVNYLESQNKIKAEGQGFSLDVDFDDQAASVDLNLSFLLKPLKSKVLALLEKELKRVL